jgi:hypothetical protein
MATMPGSRTILTSTALVNGAVLVSFCAYSRPLLMVRYYHLSPAEYAELFIPQVFAVLIFAFAAMGIARSFRTRRVFVGGLASELAALLLMLVTVVIGSRQHADYTILLIASALVGTGFGLTIPVLIQHIVNFSLISPDADVFALNIALAVGVAVTPVIAIAVVRVGLGWIVLAVLAAAEVALIVVSPRLPLPPVSRSAGTANAHVLAWNGRSRSDGIWNNPDRGDTDPGNPGFGLLLPLICVLGLGAALCVAWSQASMLPASHMPIGFRSLLLGGFWAAALIVGRIVFGAADRRRTWRRSLSLAPFLIALVVLAVGLAIGLPQTAGIGIFLLAAFSCAAFLPLTARAGHDGLTVMSLALTAAAVGFYPIGLGMAAATWQSMRHAGSGMAIIFALTGLVALAAGVVSGVILGYWPGPEATPPPLAADSASTHERSMTPRR